MGGPWKDIGNPKKRDCVYLSTSEQSLSRKGVFCSPHGRSFIKIHYLCTKEIHILKENVTMLTISDREFRANQQHYLDQVDEGEEVMVQRGQGQNYLIVPLTETDTAAASSYIMEPDEDLERAISFEEFKQNALSHIEALYNTRP